MPLSNGVRSILSFETPAADEHAQRRMAERVLEIGETRMRSRRSGRSSACAPVSSAESYAVALPSP